MTADRGGASGFTLLEMTIVLVVLALAAGLVLGHGPMRSQALEIRSTAAQLAGFLRLARAQAIALDRPQAVAIETSRHAWRDSGGTAHAIPPGMTIAMSVGGQRATDRARGAGAAPAIAFYPDGSAAGGAITVAEGSRHLTILVDWLTGRVIVGPG